MSGDLRSVRSSSALAGECQIPTAAAVRQSAEASERQRKEVGTPEVGVEVSAQVLESTALRLTTEKKYPQSYPHGPGGTLRFSPRCRSGA